MISIIKKTKRQNCKCIVQTFFSSIKFIPFVIMLSSCNFNITDNPGHQISSSIMSAKKHKTLLGSYRVSSNTINKIPIKEIFIEKRYFLKKGFFEDFEINCCESQLIIVFNEDNKTTTLDGIPSSWNIVGFDQLNSTVMIKDLKGFVSPSIINIVLIPNVEKAEIIENIQLIRIN